MLALDFLDPARATPICGARRPADMVLSDMAAPATGHAATDHLRIVALAEAAFEFAAEVLNPAARSSPRCSRAAPRANCSTASSGTLPVRHVKPPASRAESAEIYVVAQGFRERAYLAPPALLCPRFARLRLCIMRRQP